VRPRGAKDEGLGAALPLAGRHTTSRKPRRTLIATEAALVVWIAFAVGNVAYLPTHDGPQHIYTIHAANHLDASGTGWSDWFEPNLPLSNYGFTVIFSPLDLWLPWQVATRLALTLMAVAWALGAFFFVRAVQPERSWLGVALGAAALQWSLYMGFFSFYAASAFGLFVLAFAFARDSSSARVRFALAALLFLQALMHVMAALLTGLVVATLLGFRAAPGRRLRELFYTAGIGAPAAAVAFAVLWVQSSGADLPAEEIESFALERRPWWTLGKCLLGGPAWRAWPLTGLAAVALFATLALRRFALRVEDRALFVAGGAFLAAAALLPLHLPSWHFFSVRFLALGVCALVASLPVERICTRAGRVGLATALAAFAFASTAWALQYNRELAARSEAALAGLAVDLQRDGARLPIVLDPLLGRPFDDAQAAMPYAVPLLNLGKLYAVAQGGFVPFAFVSNPALHPLLLRDEARGDVPVEADPRIAVALADPQRARDLALRETVTVSMAARGSRSQDVILWGRPEDADHLLWLGFAPDWRRGGLAIARFEGCPLRIRFAPSSALGVADVLTLGWYPARDVTHRYDLSRAQRAPDGARVLLVRQSCGGVWLGFEREDIACAGADSEGRLVVREVRATPEVECRVEGASRTD
jgi:hypothetical protein